MSVGSETATASLQQNWMKTRRKRHCRRRPRTCRGVRGEQTTRATNSCEEVPLGCPGGSRVSPSKKRRGRSDTHRLAPTACCRRHCSTTQRLALGENARGRGVPREFNASEDVLRGTAGDASSFLPNSSACGKAGESGPSKSEKSTDAQCCNTPSSHHDHGTHCRAPHHWRTGNLKQKS